VAHGHRQLERRALDYGSSHYAPP